MLDKLKDIAEHDLSSKTLLLGKIDGVTEKDEMPFTKSLLSNFWRTARVLVYSSIISSLPGADPEAIDFNLHAGLNPEFVSVNAMEENDSKLANLFSEHAEIKGVAHKDALSASLHNIKNKISGHYKNPVGGTVPVFFYQGHDSLLTFHERLHQHLNANKTRSSHAVRRTGIVPAFFQGTPTDGHVNIFAFDDKGHEDAIFKSQDLEDLFVFHHELHHSTYQDSKLFASKDRYEAANLIEGSADVAGLLMVKKNSPWMNDFTFPILSRALLQFRSYWASNTDVSSDYHRNVDHSHNVVKTLVTFIAAYLENPEFFNGLSDKEIYNVSILVADVASSLDMTESMKQLLAENEIDYSPELHKKMLDDYWNTGKIPDYNDSVLFSLSENEKERPALDRKFWLEVEHRNKYANFDKSLNDDQQIANYINEIFERRQGLRIPVEFEAKTEIARGFSKYGISLSVGLDENVSPKKTGKLKLQ